MPDKTSIDVSYAETLTLTCANCGRDFDGKFWLIVDAAERPDLLERIRAGALHDEACPHCGDAGHMDAPLLLYRPDDAPVLLFSPAEETTVDEDREQARQLVEMLQTVLGTEWRDEWLAEGLRSAPRTLLSAALSDDPENAMAQMAEQAAAELARLQAEDPARFAELQAAMGSMVEEVAPLMPVIEQFIQADTWNASRRIVEQHPELLSDEAGRLLDTLIAAARMQGDDGAVQMFQEHQTLLRRCREAGIARAFAEKTLPPEALAQAEAAGITAEELLAQAEAANQIPPELRAVLAELAASGVQISTQEEFEAALAARPDLRARLEAMAQANDASRGTDMSPELQSILQELSQPARRTGMARRAQLCREALTILTRGENPGLWAALQGELGNSLVQSLSGDRAQNIEEAIAAYRQALEVRTRAAMPVEWAQAMMNLANAYYSRIRGDRAQNIEEAIAAYGKALEILTPGSLPDDCRRTARSLANLCFSEGRYAEVLEPHRLAMRAVDNLFRETLARSSQEVELAEIQGLPANAAYALARLDRLTEAVETMEAGRARLLAEALEANRRDLEQLEPLGHKDLLERYRAASAQVSSLQQAGQQPSPSSGGPPVRPDFATLRRQMEGARGELNAAIDAIRQVPGYHDFFLTPDFSAIQRAARPGAPVVYLVTTAVGSVALVVRAAAQKSGSAASVAAVWLDDFTEATLRAAIYGPVDDRALGGYLGAYQGWLRNARDSGAHQHWLDTLDRTTGWLWDAQMAPLLDHLARSPLPAFGVTLIPTGLLALLPLHAAWTEDATTLTGRRYALDALTISYVSSARALVDAREIAGRVTDDGLLTVDNPDGSLVFARQEVAAVRSYFPPASATVLQNAAATRQAVLDQLFDYPVYHFSTHGWAGWNEPLESGLMLAGGAHLTLRDLLDQRLAGARLAVLSACETGIPGTKLPDEVVSLPSGFAQAGVAGVVASLWAVNDMSTAMLMERFYRHWREDGLPPAEALRRAQIWLRDATNREMVAYFEQDVLPALTERMPTAVAADFAVSRFRFDSDARSFGHPFYWAAFTMTGV